MAKERKEYLILGACTNICVTEIQAYSMNPF